MASVVDLKSKEEKDAELDRKIEALRKKNEALIRRHQLIEEDKKRAEQEGIAVTTPRKGKNAETEPDKARKEKENFSITVAGEKRVINEGKSPKSSPRMDVSPRSPTQRITGRAGRSPQAEKPEEIFQGGSEISPPSDKPARGRRGPGAEMSRRGQEGDLPKRSPRGNRDGSPGERWASSPRGGPAGDRGGRGPGRGGGAPGRGGDAAGPDRKVKEWEERRRQNIEKMNEEMEMIAEYERSRRDGTREKNPIRNFLDDPRRSGPVADIDRKEGSRRHIRNWGGPDFEKVKTGMDRDKENHGRRPGPKSQVDMTMSMTGRERAEYMRWKKEREQIDQERLERHRKPTGQWRREWDAEKNDTMFKDDASPRVEEEPAGRRDKGRRGPPKPHTIGEFLPESLTGFSQKRAQNRGKERTKPYSMHDSRWEDPEEKKEEATVDGAEKETCLEKAEEPKSQEPRKQSKLKSSPAPAEGKEEHEDDGEWTDASGDEEEDEDDEGSSEAEQDSADEGHSEASPVTPQPAPKEQRVPPPHETPKLTIPPPSESPEEKTLEMKPTSPFSPEGHRSVTDWGEEMEQLSNRGSSNEDSPPQNQGSGARTQARSALSDPEWRSRPEEAQGLQRGPGQNLTKDIEATWQELSENKEKLDQEGVQTPETPERNAETLERGAETPEKSAETPERSVETPERSVETPERSAETPERSAETPERSVETPERSAETPERGAETPEKGVETPERSAETPERGVEGAAEVASRVEESEDSPAEGTGIKAAEEPKANAASPQRAREEPTSTAELSAPPAQIPVPPADGAVPPADGAVPPADGPVPPAERPVPPAESPASVDDVPTPAEEQLVEDPPSS